MKQTDRPIRADVAYRVLHLEDRVRVFNQGKCILYGILKDVRRCAGAWWNYEFKVVDPITAEIAWATAHNIELEDPFAEFERRLKRHDWTYEMSEDHRVWVSGNNAAADLNFRHNQLEKIDKDLTEKLWRKYAWVRH